MFPVKVPPLNVVRVDFCEERERGMSVRIGLAILSTESFAEMDMSFSELVVGKYPFGIKSS